MSEKNEKKLNFTKQQAEAACHQHYVFLKKLEEHIVAEKECYESLAKNNALEAVTGAGNMRQEKEEKARTYMAVSNAYQDVHRVLCRMNTEENDMSVEALTKL